MQTDLGATAQHVARLAKELKNLPAETPEDWDGAINSWRDRVRIVFRRYLPEEELREFERVFTVPGWRTMGVNFGPAMREDERTRWLEEIRTENAKRGKAAHERIVTYLHALGYHLMEAWVEQAPESEPLSVAPKAPASNKVFVVHGRDAGMKEAVARALGKLGLKPIILHEQPNGGGTLIQKFADYADVSFAAVLLSPDDIGALASERDRLRPRARQNVVLELGYFWAKLGSRNVLPLLKNDGDIDVPSDYDGVAYTPFDPAGAWQSKLVQELKHAGFMVKYEDLFD